MKAEVIGLRAEGLLYWLRRGFRPLLNLIPLKEEEDLNQSSKEEDKLLLQPSAREGDVSFKQSACGVSELNSEKSPCAAVSLKGAKRR